MKAGSIHPTLIKDCLANRRAAQRELYDRCLPYLSVIAKRYLRNGENLKDVLQDSFLQLFSNLSQFDASRASFKTWAGKQLPIPVMAPPAPQFTKPWKTWVSTPAINIKSSLS